MDKRLFIGVKIYPSAQFLELYNMVKYEFKNELIKWVPPENIHITLKFLGETPDFKLQGISNVIKSTVLQFNEFEDEIRGLGYFGSRSVKIIWMGIDCGKELISLADNLNNNLRTMGFENNEKEFIPHLTLSRVKNIDRSTELKKFLNNYKSIFVQHINIKEVCLFESLLNPEGAEYRIIDSFPCQFKV